MFKSLALIAAFALTALAPASADSMTDGVIKKIDLKNSKVTVKHGEIVNLEMPAMSMVFTVKDPAMLEGVAKGDKVKFIATEEGGKFFITEIESAD